MGAEMNFDATTVNPDSPFEPIPNGIYRMHVAASEVKATKDGRGQYLQLELVVLDGEMKGRKVWERLNIVNPNSTAQEIAQRTLSAICHATGVMQVANSSQLHHIPMLVTVVVKEDKGYGPRNEVKKYEADPSTGRGVAPSGAAPRPAAPAPATETPPWARKSA